MTSPDENERLAQEIFDELKGRPLPHISGAERQEMIKRVTALMHLSPKESVDTLAEIIDTFAEQEQVHESPDDPEDAD